MPAGFRPWHPVNRSIQGWRVDARGIPSNPVQHINIDIEVLPNGDVHYLDSDPLHDVEYIGYQLNTAWETAESPDRAVLHDIYDSIVQNAREAKVLHSWLRPDVPLAEWYDVSTNEWGRVIHLNLSNVSLRDGFPESLGLLHHLKVLRLGSEGGMGGHGRYSNRPESVSDLVNLEVLDLIGLPLQGPLPAAWGKLEKLKTLNLTWTDYAGPLPPEWSALKNLEYLELADVAVSGPLPTEWYRMENLQTLALTGTELTGPLPDAWCLMPRLRVLDIRGAAMSGGLPASWGNLENLEFVSLGNTGITGVVPPEWLHIPGLELVNLGSVQTGQWELRQRYPQNPDATSEVTCPQPYPVCTDGYTTNTQFCELVRRLQ